MNSSVIMNPDAFKWVQGKDGRVWLPYDELILTLHPNHFTLRYHFKDEETAEQQFSFGLLTGDTLTLKGLNGQVAITTEA